MMAEFAALFSNLASNGAKTQEFVPKPLGADRNNLPWCLTGRGDVVLDWAELSHFRFLWLVSFSALQNFGPVPMA
jgi:hypothetical protein